MSEHAQAVAPNANGKFTLPENREPEVRVPAGEPGWVVDSPPYQSNAPTKGEYLQVAVMAASLPVLAAVAIASVRANGRFD